MYGNIQFLKDSLVQVLWNGKKTRIVAIGSKCEKPSIKTLKSLDFSRDFDVWCQIGNNRWLPLLDSNQRPCG